MILALPTQIHIQVASCIPTHPACKACAFGGRLQCIDCAFLKRILQHYGYFGQWNGTVSITRRRHTYVGFHLVLTNARARVAKTWSRIGSKADQRLLWLAAIVPTLASQCQHSRTMVRGTRAQTVCGPGARLLLLRGVKARHTKAPAQPRYLDGEMRRLSLVLRVEMRAL